MVPLVPPPAVVIDRALGIDDLLASDVHRVHVESAAAAAVGTADVDGAGVEQADSAEAGVGVGIVHAADVDDGEGAGIFHDGAAAALLAVARHVQSRAHVQRAAGQRQARDGVAAVQVDRETRNVRGVVGAGHRYVLGVGGILPVRGVVPVSRIGLTQPRVGIGIENQSFFQILKPGMRKASLPATSLALP